VSIPFGDGLQYAIAAIAALGVAFYFSWKLTLVVVCTVPLMYIIQLLLSKKMESRANDQADQLQTALKFATNAISSIETVKCFNGERTELNTFTKLTALSADLYKGVANIRSMQIGIIQFFTLCVFVQGFWYGSYLIATGDMDAGAVITTFWAALLAIANITGFLPQLIVMQKGKMSGAKLRVVMDKISGNNEQHEALGDQRPPQCLGRLEFKDVRANSSF
jgi:ATP-binding cassette subfamily B (MDR/TAP) protein 1